MRRLLTLVFALLSTFSLSSWQWPIDFERVPRLYTAINDYYGVSTIFRFQVGSGENENVPIVVPAEGEVIFLGPPFPQTDLPSFDLLPDVPSLVIRTPEEFWIIIYIDRPSFAGSVSGDIDGLRAGQVVGRAETFSFSIFDVRTQQYINPRVVLPFTDSVAPEQLPDVRLVQDGMVIPPDQLSPGEVEIVVPLTDTTIAFLPRTISVTARGEQIGAREFIFSESVLRYLDTARGWLSLATAQVADGAGVYVIEGKRFDGSVLRRSVNYSVTVDEEIPAP